MRSVRKFMRRLVGIPFPTHTPPLEYGDIYVFYVMIILFDRKSLSLLDKEDQTDLILFSLSVFLFLLYGIED